MTAYIVYINSMMTPMDSLSVLISRYHQNCTKLMMKILLQFSMISIKHPIKTPSHKNGCHQLEIFLIMATLSVQLSVPGFCGYFHHTDRWKMFISLLQLFVINSMEPEFFNDNSWGNLRKTWSFSPISDKSDNFPPPPTIWKVIIFGTRN